MVIQIWKKIKVHQVSENIHHPNKCNISDVLLFSYNIIVTRFQLMHRSTDPLELSPDSRERSLIPSLLLMYSICSWLFWLPVLNIGKALPHYWDKDSLLLMEHYLNRNQSLLIKNVNTTDGFAWLIPELTQVRILLVLKYTFIFNTNKFSLINPFSSTLLLK